MSTPAAPPGGLEATPPPSGETVTLDNCAREPIHIPGLIQPHGALVAFEAATSVIRHASTNLQHWLPSGMLPLKGRPLSSLIDRPSWERIERAVRAPGMSNVRHSIVAVRSSDPTKSPVHLQALVHRHRGHCFLELEPQQEHDEDWMQAHADVMSSLRGARDLEDLLSRLTAQVKRFCGFDRVIVYRFHDDWHGEVVAEKCEPEMEPFLGLHYPASDIPAQARELYRTNLVRYVAAVDYVPVPVLPWVDPLSNEPLDLSHATLRSVSPIHLQYLRNMGVNSTLTMSIMLEGRLWGLVTCHHRAPTRVALRMRQTCEALAIGASYLVAWHSQHHRIEAARQSALLQGEIVTAFNQVEVSLAEVVETSSTALLRLAGATAGALWHRGELIAFGAWPSGNAGQALADFAARKLETSDQDVMAFDELDPALQSGSDDHRRIGGCIVVRLGDLASSALMWLRPEHRQEVTWGGNPDKPAQLTHDANGAAVLSPRASFERWSSQVRGKCRPWTDTDMDAVQSILPLRRLLAVKDALSDVRESDRRFRALLDLQSDAYWQLDAAGRVVTLSKPLPVDIGPVSEQTLPELFAPFCTAETIDAVAQALASNEPFRDLRLSSTSHDEHNEFELLLSGDPLRDQHFKVVGFHGTLTDVTQTLKIGRELRLREAAEMANRTKSTFLSQVSHELRTPLNAVLGFSQMLINDASVSTEQRKEAEHIQKAGQWLLAMISDLLDLGGLEAGKLRFDLLPVEVGTVIERAIGHLQNSADAASVRVRFESLGQPAWVRADPKRLKQVLVNLISNAIKYNHPGGTIDLEVAPVDANGFVAVAVRDSGSGLDAAQLAHIFEPFNRLGRENQSIHGSGIGLVVTQQIVQAMGGRIDVTSQPLKGSCFTVYLPATAPADDATLASRSEPPDPEVLNRNVVQPLPAMARPSQPGLVLYVEDDPMNVELMKAIVETSTSARIVVAGTAEEGLALAREQRPDLMLIDINLPGENGTWLLRAIRRDAALQQTFCIAVTADAMQDALSKLRLQGFDQCWHKPVNLRWSGQAIEVVLAAQRAAGPLQRLSFADPRAFEALASSTDLWLDTLDFGVVKLDAAGRVLAYNLRESLLTGYEPTAVIGRDFFSDIGRCMNNPQVAGRFDSAGTLDTIVETVFRLQLRRLPVRLRLLKHADWPQRYLLVDRLDALAGG